MNKETGQVIKAFRKHFGYTQDFVAKEISITPQTLASIENGRVGVDLDKLHRIAKLFKISDGLILDLAKEVVETKDDTWLEKAVKKLRRISTDEDEL